MANSLLDFVMSVVRDPDVAARYAADPAQAIADAHLTGVTSADVNQLIPVVSESLSMGGSGLLGAGAADANVWASGAATAAFDAFGAPAAVAGAAEHAAVIDHTAALPVDIAAHAPIADLPVGDLTPLVTPEYDQLVHDLPIDDPASADPALFDHPQLDDHWHAAGLDDGFFH